MVQRRPGYKETVMPVYIGGGRLVSAFSSIQVDLEFFVCLSLKGIYPLLQLHQKWHLSFVCVGPQHCPTEAKGFHLRSVRRNCIYNTHQQSTIIKYNNKK
jgi:hypothetical protein